MNSPQIRAAPYIAELQSLGTMSSASSIYPCRITFPPCCINTNILHLNTLRIIHTRGTDTCTGPHNNSPRHQIPPTHFNYQKLKESRKLWALYFTMPEQWMQQCQWPQERLQPNRPVQPRRPEQLTSLQLTLFNMQTQPLRNNGRRLYWSMISCGVMVMESRKYSK